MHAGADSGITNDITESGTQLQKSYDVKEDRDIFTSSTVGNPSVTFASLDEYSTNKVNYSATNSN